MTGSGKARGLLVAAFVLATTTPSWAAAQLTDEKNNCTGTNCQAKTLKGSYRLDNQGRAVPFEAELFSAGNECVRVQVIQQVTDLEIVLVSPDGFFWRNDDSFLACTRCPLVKVNAGQAGWYTLQVSHFVGAGSTGDFTIKYGRYNSGNPNCNNPTQSNAPTRTAPKPQ